MLIRLVCPLELTTNRVKLRSRKKEKHLLKHVYIKENDCFYNFVKNQSPTSEISESRYEIA